MEKYKASVTSKVSIDGGWINIVIKKKATITSQAPIAERHNQHYQYNLKLTKTSQATHYPRAPTIQKILPNNKTLLAGPQDRLLVLLAAQNP